MSRHILRRGVDPDGCTLTPHVTDVVLRITEPSSNVYFLGAKGTYVYTVYDAQVFPNVTVARHAFEDADIRGDVLVQACQLRNDFALHAITNPVTKFMFMPARHWTESEWKYIVGAANRWGFENLDVHQTTKRNKLVVAQPLTVLETNYQLNRCVIRSQRALDAVRKPVLMVPLSQVLFGLDHQRYVHVYKIAVDIYRNNMLIVSGLLSDQIWDLEHLGAMNATATSAVDHFRARRVIRSMIADLLRLWRQAKGYEGTTLEVHVELRRIDKEDSASYVSGEKVELVGNTVRYKRRGCTRIRRILRTTENPLTSGLLRNATNGT